MIKLNLQALDELDKDLAQIIPESVTKREHEEGPHATRVSQERNEENQEKGRGL